jgi:hypothetical protein
MVRVRLRAKNRANRANMRYFRISTPNRIRDFILHQVPWLHYPDRSQVISARVRISLVDFVLLALVVADCPS